MACMNQQPRNRHLIVFLLTLAFLCISTSHLMVQGRQIPNAHGHLKQDEEIGVKQMRTLIGSRPPKCEQRCRNCGQCRAVQVPIAPAIKFLHEERVYGDPMNRVQYSRGDDISSYKPMCWKCKCGDFFFNP